MQFTGLLLKSVRKNFGIFGTFICLVNFEIGTMQQDEFGSYLSKFFFERKLLLFYILMFIFQVSTL